MHRQNVDNDNADVQLVYVLMLQSLNCLWKFVSSISLLYIVQLTTTVHYYTVSSRTLNSTIPYHTTTVFAV